jgi:TPR repeat protein
MGVDLCLRTALSYFKTGAEMGHANSNKKCADILYSGAGCLRPDKDLAYQYYEKAAGLGNIESINCLGIMNEKGWEMSSPNLEKVKQLKD